MTLPELRELVRRIYGAHVYHESVTGRIWVQLPEHSEPLCEDELVNIGNVVYRVRLYLEDRDEYLVVPFADVITSEEWPSLEEEPRFEKTPE